MGFRSLDVLALGLKAVGFRGAGPLRDLSRDLYETDLH